MSSAPNKGAEEETTGTFPSALKNVSTKKKEEGEKKGRRTQKKELLLRSPNISKVYKIYTKQHIKLKKLKVVTHVTMK